ncbi:cellulose biosynthesis protein BcsQ [Zobellella sp. DQSA1]|uniref:cellulose biosynthesis protein BcsQ n=1 Tax=Zobellella sp. DQSA1 TaxID=3342386 RepID=UPI0035BF1E26
MTLMRFKGIRGGVGTSSLLVGLAYELNRLDQRVLMVDFCPENQLRLHLGLPFNEQSGWAQAWRMETDWCSQAWELLPGLCLLPYGRLEQDEWERLEHWLRRHPDEWRRRLAGLSEDFDWILIDAPLRLPGHAGCFRPQLDIQVLCADAACHALLQHQDGDVKLLVNGHDAGSRLQQDLLLLWRRQYQGRMLPLSVCQDEAVAEALAHKRPVGAYAPDSAAADVLRSLAVWCLGRREATC